MSGLGINKDKSAVISTGSPRFSSQIKLDLKSSPWPDLVLKESGTHLGILIGRDVTLENIWASPMAKAEAKLKNCRSLIHSFPLPTRLLFINVFIVSLFSYHALFFIFPTELWKKIKNLISRSVIPFNGGAFSYSSLVCAKKIFFLKTTLKDIWAFNISLLAVRSPLFSQTSNNYHQLPTINTRFNMHISDHRDAAAVDFWRSRHLPDGTLVPPPPLPH